MKTVGSSNEMISISTELLALGKTIGFVPTMGALHEGHLSLIRAARQQCDVVVASIFVNPTQFNDPKDYERYPRTIAADSALLIREACDYLFVPETVNEVFPGNYHAFDIDFGPIQAVLEGAHRPGHFKGVANVVYRLFEIVKPSFAFFGLKDYQQFLIIKEMVRQKGLAVQLKGISTGRAASGLALSSRNQLLSVDERNYAAHIYEALQLAKTIFNAQGPANAKAAALEFFKNKPLFDLEYFEIADGESLESADFAQDLRMPVAFVATKLGKVRLIDNIFLKEN